jgi:major vault protein
MADRDSVIRIKPFYYIHVLDNNTNVTRVEVGPQTFTRQEHEKIVGPPEPMVLIPPRHYVVISNPVVKVNGVVSRDRYGNCKLRHGDEEIREAQDPFPLYPGEKVVGKVSPLQVVAPDTALRLRSLRDFTDAEGKARTAGDEWLSRGPNTYTPRIDVQVVEVIKATVIKENQAIKLRARLDLLDSHNVARKAGEEYLVRAIGAFIPDVNEEIVETVKAIVLTEKKALHLRASRTFKDVFGKERKAGDEWLITIKDTEAHIPDVNEAVVGEVQLTTLNNRQYCVVLDPVDRVSGRNQLGKRELRKGELTFFLRPGERLEQGIQAVNILGSEEALLLRARESFQEPSGDPKKPGAKHMPGDRWMIYGPCEYVPSVEVEVIERRKAIPLDENEGVYVRDLKTGAVRLLYGKTYMLLPNEELWEKDLPAIVDELLGKELRTGESAAPAKRVKTAAVTYRAPHNSAVQVFDYRDKKSRVVFGPELVMLGPDEHFTVVSLSGGKPKTPGKIKALATLLGPDFMTDIVLVETSDHARLSLQLAYNWHFKVNKESQPESLKLFSVPDFVGDACKTIASRVRGAVARVSFDEFHRQSAEVIRSAVFGNGSNEFIFPANNLVITGIDIQSVEPVDQRTRDSLQKSVQLAIEITTKSQEATARHEAERLEQEARGRLERQKINDESEAEKSRKRLLELQAESAAVEATGQATAEARAKANASAIEGEAQVTQAKLQSEAQRIKLEAELKQKVAAQDAEIAHLKDLNTLEIAKAKDLATIEAKKFGDIVSSIGADTICSMAQAGPEMQAKLLQGLGLQGYLITDGNSPINLFNTAQGMLGGGI